MDLKELIEKAHRLRRQESELRERLTHTTAELEEVKLALDKALQEDGRSVSELTEEEFQRMLSELDDAKQISVAVVYATRDKQRVEEIHLNAGANIEDGIMVSGILRYFPEIDLAACKVGIHGAVKPLTHILQSGDRIEIYRPVSKD